MFSTTRLVDKIREEYVAMPGLKLTREQACRLWSVGHETCTAALNVLLAEGFLHQTGTGKYVTLPRPGGTALSMNVEQLAALHCPHCGKRMMVARAQMVRGLHELALTVRCECCYRLINFYQQSA
jgi:predicted RNA-binding Zn-ribbon protein involved in translation (DUF1610 family)